MKTIKFEVVKEVELNVPNSWTQNELKNLATDLCDSNADVQNDWNLNKVEYETKLKQIKIII